MRVGFPIRKSSDQSLFAAPQGLSQRTTSFIASQRQGIHQIPLLHLITLIIDAHTFSRTCDHRRINLERPHTFTSFARLFIVSRRYPPERFPLRRPPQRSNKPSLHDVKSTRHKKITRIPKGETVIRTRRPITEAHTVSEEMVEPDGIEPTTSCLQSTRSSN